MSNSFIRFSFLALAVASLPILGCNNGTNADSNGKAPQDSTGSSVITKELPVLNPDSVVYRAAEVEGMVRFKTAADLYGFFGSKGDTAVPAKYDVAFDFKDGLAKVKQNGKTGFINLKGEEVIPPTYEKVTNFTEGKAAVLIDGKWGFLDTKNNLVLPAVYDTTQAFGEGLVPVMREGAKFWSYVDLKGKVVIGEDQKLEAAWPFSEGLAHGMKENLWGYFDKKGKVVIPFKYFNAGRFEEGSAPVQTDSQWMRIDKKGKCVKNCEPQAATEHSAGDGHNHEGHDHEGHDHEGHDH